jgi:hypothetical protein
VEQGLRALKQNISDLPTQVAGLEVAVADLAQVNKF